MRRPLLKDTIQRIGVRLGASVEFEPEYGFVGSITFANGRRVLFHDSRLPLNTNTAVQIARDKGHTAYFLRSFGYSVPRQQTFFRPNLARALGSERQRVSALDFARALGFPVYLKPCHLSQGRFVTKVYNDDEFQEAADLIFRHDTVLIVQANIDGKDYRVVTLDDDVLCAYQRVPLHVVGDGKATVQDLLYNKQADFIVHGRDTKLRVDDSRIDRCLHRQQLELWSVPSAHRVVQLHDIANLSVGGTTIDITRSLHPSVRDLAIRVARDLGLRFSGVDILMDDACSARDVYAIIEVNSAPGLDNYQYSGAAQETYTDSLYERVIRALEKPPT